MDNSTEPLTHEPQEIRPTPLVRGVGGIFRRLKLGSMLSLQNPILLGGKVDSVERLRIRGFVSVAPWTSRHQSESPIQARDPETMALGRLSKLSKIPVHRKILLLVGETPLPTFRAR